MKKLTDILIYLQIKKIELKMNYFKDLEKIRQCDVNQVKSSESQVISEKIQLLLRHFQLNSLSEELKNYNQKVSTTIYNIVKEETMSYKEDIMELN